MTPYPINNYQQNLKEAALTILNCHNNYGAIKASVDQMYSVFKALTEVGFENQNEEAIYTAWGKAVAPPVAAFCLMEIKRTAVFLRGIYKAIKQKHSEKNGETVSILYAGTGPYATLITPLIPLLMPNDVLIDFLEINPVSLNSAVKLFQELEMSEFIESAYLDDASTFKVKKPYDIVISETMQAALKREPQVSITRNIMSQLDENTILIPEAITINAFLGIKSNRIQEEKGFSVLKKIDIDNLFVVDKYHYHPETFRGSVKIPLDYGECNQLKLDTIIKVYEDEYLSNGDCSLNVPVKVCELTSENSSLVHFWYETGEVPGICLRFDNQTEVYKANGRTII